MISYTELFATQSIPNGHIEWNCLLFSTSSVTNMGEARTVAREGGLR
jgi:hypothetical protein